MKKSIVMMLLILPTLFAACKGDSLEVAGLTFNDSPSSVKSGMNAMGYEIIKDMEDYVCAEGEISAFGLVWYRVNCEFENNKLKEINLFRRGLVGLEDINDLNNQLESLCGKSDPHDKGSFMDVYFGNEENNNGYIGRLSFVFDSKKCDLSIYCAD